MCLKGVTFIGYMDTFQSDMTMVFGLVAILFIWFDTTAFTEWARLLRISFFYKDFEAVQKSPTGHIVAPTYIDYLLNKYNKSFLIKMITCSECLTVWVNVIAMIIFHNSIGGWSQLPMNLFLTWFLYHMLRRIAKHE